MQWERKFYESWPSTKKIYSTTITNDDFCTIDFTNQVKEAVKFRKNISSLLSQMSEANLDDTNKREIVVNFLCATSRSVKYYIAVDELRQIISQSPRVFGCDLTQRYYSSHIYRQLKYFHIMYKLLEFTWETKEQQFLEQMISYLIQWFNVNIDIFNDISYSHIKTTLDHLAEKVLQVLKEEDPSHPIFTRSKVFHDYWQNNNVFYTEWNHNEILKILTVIEKIVFLPSYFHKLNQLWVKTHKNESGMVISEGIQSICFLTIYHSVLRRLGIYSVLILKNVLQIFLKTEKKLPPEYICVQLQKSQLSLMNFIRRDNREKNHLMINMTLIEYLKEREQNLNIQDKGQLLLLWHILEGNPADIIDLLRWECNLNIKKSEPERSAELKFVIGTIVTHKCNHYKTHFGVIAGWHHYFNFNSIKFGISFQTLPDNYSKISCKNVDNCIHSDCLLHKPYYIILCENNEYCYVQEDNISICSSTKWINHDEIGRYFSRYEHTYYVPNEMLARNYPCDIAKINKRT
ncbi:uncharacterized protein LOC126855516 isoform X2 [Cataglyphis hispanica]|uniref:uncharacterized protein LOC126855516 isoform X2 n=1 Tax=Cataglyphis hispanica TaxID=1086592 RepID=UPI00217FF005|nr:uncharacterized protein LOC126855516 isoform X2 [Cataglyphis hispanica]